MFAFKLLGPYLKTQRRLIWGGFAALIVCDLSKLAIPTVLGRAIDFLSKASATASDLLKPLVLILALTIVTAATRFTWRTLILGFSRQVVRGLRLKLYEKMLSLPPQWQQRQNSGDLMAMATNDMDNIRLAISTGLIVIIDSLMLGGLTLGFMLAISREMTLWALVPLPWP